MAEINLGYDHFLEFMSWAPDRDLNPQYTHLPDCDRIGAIVRHTAKDGTECRSGIMFDCAQTREAFKEKTMWKVETWEPLTLSPSLLCLRCGDHGFIRDGRWVRA